MTPNLPFGVGRTATPQGLDERIKTLSESIASRATPDLLRGWFGGRPLELLPREAGAVVDLFCSPGADTQVEEWSSATAPGNVRVRHFESLGVWRMAEVPAPVLAVILDDETYDPDLESLFRLEVKGRLAVVIVSPDVPEACEAFRITLEPFVGRVVLGTLGSPGVQEILRLTATTDWKLASAVLTRALLLELTLPRLRTVLQNESERISALLSQINASLGEMGSDTSFSSARVSPDDVVRRFQEKHTEFVTTLKKPRSGFEWGLLCPADRGESGWVERERVESTLTALSWADTDEEGYREPRLRRISPAIQHNVTQTASRMVERYVAFAIENWNETLRNQTRVISDWLTTACAMRVQLPFFPLSVAEVQAAFAQIPSDPELLPGVPVRPVTFLGIARSVAMKGAPITAMIVTPIVFILRQLNYNVTFVTGFVSLSFVTLGFIIATRRWRPERDFNKKEIVDQLRESLNREVRQIIKERGDVTMALIERHLDKQRQETKEVVQPLFLRMQSSQSAAATAEKQLLQARKQVLDSELKTVQDLLQACTSFLKDLPAQVMGIRQQLRPSSLAAGARRP